MCRMLVYCSDTPILLFDLICAPSNSLVQQSFCGGFHPDCATKNNMTLNADGFGIGWYGKKSELTTAVGPPARSCVATFRSVTPAWSNRNLRELAGVVESRCCFAHVRAATPGSIVNEENCHPFRCGRLLWQHNGHIEGFSKLKRRIVEHLTDDVYAGVDGATDSEHCFALFCSQLKDPKQQTQPFKTGELELAMRKTIAILRSLIDQEKITKGFSTCNFALTDGHTVVITRYCDKAPKIPPPSLYFAYSEAATVRENLNCGDGLPSRPAYGIELRDVAQEHKPTTRVRRSYSCDAPPPCPKSGKQRTWRCVSSAFMCASEPLSRHAGEWKLVPENTMLTYSLCKGALEMSSLANLGDVGRGQMSPRSADSVFAAAADTTTKIRPSHTENTLKIPVLNLDIPSLTLDIPIAVFSNASEQKNDRSADNGDGETDDDDDNSLSPAPRVSA